MSFADVSELEEEAKKLLKEGLNVYYAKFGVTVKSVTDVLPPYGESVFVSLQCQEQVCYTDARLLPDVAEEEFEFGDKLVLSAVLARRNVQGSLEKDVVRDGTKAEGFLECLATLTLCEEGMGDKVRDYGIVNLSNFVYGLYSITDTSIDLKLGGGMTMNIECSLQPWEEVYQSKASRHIEYENTEEFSELTARLSSVLTTTPEPPPELPEQTVTKEYGELYKAPYTGGEWSEYPVIHEVNGAHRMRFWSIEGPVEPLYEESDEEIWICGYRIRRRRRGCRAGETPRFGKMTRVQRLRGWAEKPFFVGGAICSMDKLSKGRRPGVGIRAVREGFGDSEGRPGRSGGAAASEEVLMKRISECSEGSENTNAR